MDSINFNEIIDRLLTIKCMPNPAPLTEEVKGYLTKLLPFIEFALSGKEVKKANNLIGRTEAFTREEVTKTRALFRISRTAAFFLELNPAADLEPPLEFIKESSKRGINMDGIIKFLNISPEVDLTTLFTQAIPLINFCSKCSQLCNVINEIALFPSEERAEICRLAKQLLEGLLQGIDLKTLDDNNVQSKIIAPLKGILQAKRKDFCRLILLSIKDEPLLSNRMSRLTEAASKIQTSHSESVSEPEASDYPDLSAMPYDEKKALLTAMNTEGLNKQQKIWASQIIGYFAPENRLTVLRSFQKFPFLQKPFSLVNELLKDPVLSENTHAFLKARLSAEPSEEVAENLAGVLIAKCEAFHIFPETAPWKTMLRAPLARMTATSLRIPLEKRADFCQKARDLWPHAPYDHYANHLFNLEQLLQLLPVGERIAPLSSPFLLSLVKDTERFEREAPIIGTIALLFAESDRSIILEIISHMLAKAPLTNILAILERHPPLALSLSSHLIDKLNTETNPNQAGQLAHFILIHMSYFSLFAEKDFLAYIAVRTMIAATNHLVDPKNPYVIFKKLIDSAKQPTPEAPYISKVRLQFGKIFETARTSIPQAEVLEKTHGEPLNAAVLENLIQSFRDRVSASPHQEAIEEYVKTSTNFSLTTLLYNLENPFFTELLNKPYQEEIPLQQAMMSSLTQFFLDLSNEVPEGALLSPREDALCKMSASIQNCNQGKAEGLSLTYAILEERYRYSAESDIDVIKKATAFVRESLQKSITDQLSSNCQMMRALVGKDPEEQLAHHSVYLKNLLGPHIGMPHPIQLDPHTGTLEDSLVRRSLHTLLDIFYTYFDVETAKVSLQKAFSQLPQTTKRPIYNGIVELLAPRIGSHNIFNLDEETGEILSLQDNAAKELLLALGIGELA